jgi:FkbM family methyltransferase
MNTILIVIIILIILLVILLFYINKSETFNNDINILKNIQNQLKLDYGSFDIEVPEQLMAIKYIKGNEKVLEIGGNIGRNTMIIGYILNNNNNNNFVSLECDTDISNQLIHNRDLNKLDFYIENAALSKRPLIQKNWDTIVSDVVLDGYKKVNTIDYSQLYNKYKIDFDTLVLDCEGAFYYILMDMPEILNNIKLIIMENDYHDIEHKIYIDKILKENNFKVDYTEGGGWGECADYFFQVWIKL